MPCTNSLPEMSLPDPTSRQTGNHEDSVYRTPKTNNPNDKDLARLLSTQPQCQDHGIIDWSLWILTEPEHQEGIGEAEDEACRGEM